jgi:N-acetylglucosamine-6-phosphate deacetylase
MLALQHAILYTPQTRIDDAALVIDDGIIQHIGASESLNLEQGATVIDARGKIVAPGFIDLQLNGAFGDDFTAQPETIWRAAEQLPRFGVTSFLPTVITSPLEKIDAARHVLKNRPAHFRGAEPLGLHLEGPFLSPQKKGAHNPAYLREPRLNLVQDWSREHGVWLVTLAPELPNALALLRELAARDVVVSMGHTLANVDQANSGYDAGIRYATHLFNAMPPLEHRAPNAPGAVLSNPEWCAGIIPDGIHLHPALVKMIWLAKGARVNLVSDAMAALGMAPGVYRLNDFDVVVSEWDARLQNGTLAGSILPLDQAVRNFIQFTDCALSDALATVTTTPAQLLKIQNERGHIAQGMRADLVLLDESLNVHITIARGEIVFNSQSPVSNL